MVRVDGATRDYNIPKSCRNRPPKVVWNSFRLISDREFDTNLSYMTVNRKSAGEYRT